MSLLQIFLGFASLASLVSEAYASPALLAPCAVTSDAGGQNILPTLPDSFWHPITGSLKKVRDGLTLTVERRVAVFGTGHQLVAQVTGRCRLVYDLWAEKFIIKDSLYEAGQEISMPGSQGRNALLRCVTLPLPKINFDSMRVQVLINPIDEQQEARTRDWLATKGIGGAGTGIMGRAMGAVINLKTESKVEYDCRH
ncbi:MAG: hypothetical protein NTV34_06900 [Proteobacteria bacterium]|nr:hypothetical protein [Pseudomonadota bacterium]